MSTGQAGKNGHARKDHQKTHNSEAAISLIEQFDDMGNTLAVAPLPHARLELQHAAGIRGGDRCPLAPEFTLSIFFSRMFMDISVCSTL